MLTTRKVENSTKNNKFFETGAGLDSNSNTLKWTMKTRDNERTYNNTKQLEDFEKLFYQSMPYEKGKNCL